MAFSHNIRRISQVVAALVSNGLGWAVHRYGLAKHLPLFRRVYYHNGSEEEVPVKLRKSMEHLGGAFVKLGQMLSLREDLVPPEYCKEFRKLLDQVPPMSIREVKTIISAELGKPWSQCYESIEAKPLGSASIAQVHKAKLKSGRTIVIKVQRPEVAQLMVQDIALLYSLARRLQHRLYPKIDPVRIVQEFERYTLQELDFRHEANNIELFHRGYAHQSAVVIPKVYWHYSTNRILTMEFLEGRKLSEFRPKNPHAVAKKVIDTMVFQVFELGVFHADLHPGNVLFMSNGRLGFIDFGIVGRFNQKLRNKGVELWIAMTNNDIDGIVHVLEDVGFADQSADTEAFRRSVYEAMRDWGVEEKRPSHTFRILFQSAMDHHIHMPLDMVLLAKALLTVEGACTAIDPEFDFYEYATAHSSKMYAELTSPKAVASTFASKTREFADIMYRIPKETLHLLDHVKHGKILIDLDDTDIKHLGWDINQSSNRLSYAMLVSALAVTGALTINIGPGAFGFSFISIAFFALAFFFCWPLIISILHEGHPKYDPH